VAHFNKGNLNLHKNLVGGVMIIMDVVVFPSPSLPTIDAK
jgi:hypothetical protein